MHTKTKKILALYGAGGHGKVVLDALLALEKLDYVIVIIDDDLSKLGKNFLGYEVKPSSFLDKLNAFSFHVAIGDNSIRSFIFNNLSIKKIFPLSIAHRDASISKFAKIGKGNFFASHSIIGPGVSIGRGVIINHGASVDHDSIIGDYCHIGPNATICGEVKIGSNVLIGANSTILPNVTINNGAVIGAGSVVVSNILSHEVVAGIPASPLKHSL